MHAHSNSLLSYLFTQKKGTRGEKEIRARACTKAPTTLLLCTHTRGALRNRAYNLSSPAWRPT